jgi:hypothetical protein
MMDHWTCLRCGRSWIPRRDTAPVRCADKKCNSKKIKKIIPETINIIEIPQTINMEATKIKFED